MCHSTFPSINLFYSGFILYTYQFVQSAFVPLRKAGRFVGVHYLVKYLSSVINKNISDSSRYCYLIDTNSSALISHPKLTEFCYNISCAEGFSTSEYTAFFSSVLLPIRNGSLSSHTFYMKQGQSWLITGTKMEYGDVQYTVLATMLRSEVKRPLRISSLRISL